MATATLNVRIPVSRFPGDAAEASQILNVAWGVLMANVEWLRSHPEAPCCLGCGGVRYVPPEPCGALCQNVDSAAIVVARKAATCIAAAAYEGAKMILDGKSIRLQIEPTLGKDGKPILHAWHVTILLADGTTYDPTKELELSVGNCLTGVCRGRK